MIERRDLLKLLGLATLAIAGAGSLSACQPDERDAVAIDDVTFLKSDATRVAGDEASATAMVGAMDVTGARLYGALAGEGVGNLVVSPYSILVALGLTLNGAVGETQRQLVDLYGGADVDAINAGLNALTTQVESESGPAQKDDGTETEVVLAAANALFGQSGTRFEQPFLDTFASEYGAGMQTVDYVGESEKARQAVNAWTAQQTRDKIPEILPAGAVDDLTRLVLVNTLYLKAPWERPFVDGRTASAPFTLLDGTTTEVDLMESDLGSRPAAVGDGWQVVQLAYAGGGLAMTLVLPDPGRFDEIEADVVAGGIGSYLDAVSPMMATVKLPRWTFRTQAPLVGPLQVLGVEDAFDPGKADLSAMTTDEDLHLSAVLHEVFIAVDEEGTEAAAATAGVLGTTSAPVVELELVADRPYLFVIHDVARRTPLFLGRVVDPSA